MPRIPLYKTMLRVLGLPGGYARKPCSEPGDHTLRALARLIDTVGLRELEGVG
ncbi:hypothetical protein [Streptomyces sp. NPDC005017]|uniref:hypothetical protein n=1 Tax=Streptomyces sp. NPDC005017 TaxID=3364706 RepID=UPI0036C9496C